MLVKGIVEEFYFNLNMIFLNDPNRQLENISSTSDPSIIFLWLCPTLQLCEYTRMILDGQFIIVKSQLEVWEGLETDGVSDL